MSNSDPSVSVRGADTPTVMTIEDWTRSDLYHNSFLLANDPILDGVQRHSKSQGLREIAVSPAQGKLLNLLVKTSGAKRVLEVGTLGGYSAIWLARGLPEDGTVTTLELDENVAKVARENIASAGFSDKITVIVGPALDTLQSLKPSLLYDFAFIDANKDGSLEYLLEAKRLVKSGGIIIVDNVVLEGTVADPSISNSLVEGVRRLLVAIKADKDIEATTIATAGVKGYDGFLYAIRK